MFVSFQSDPLGIELRRYFGAGSLMWGSDYPHSESTFPRSREVLDELLVDVFSTAALEDATWDG